MHTAASIRCVGDVFHGRAIDLPELPGVYAFWWISPKEKLLSANRHIVLKGPKEQPVDVEYRDWWPPELQYPCLYVGKSTNIKNRFSYILSAAHLVAYTNRTHATLKRNPAPLHASYVLVLNMYFQLSRTHWHLFFDQSVFHTGQISLKMQSQNVSSRRIVLLEYGAHGLTLIQNAKLPSTRNNRRQHFSDVVIEAKLWTTLSRHV